MVYINIYAITDSELLDDDVKYLLGNINGAIADKLRAWLVDLDEDVKKRDYTFSISTMFEYIKDPFDRAMVLSSIYDVIILNKITIPKENVEIKFFIMTPDAQVYIVKDFEKITSQIDKLNQQVRKSIMDNYLDFQMERDRLENEYKDDKGNDMTDTQAMVLSQSLTKLMLKTIDEHEEEFQNQMNADILSVRKEDDSIKNELDIVNKFMADNKLEEVKSCKYNGEEITVNELVEKLHSHVLPAYLTQINIMDTLQDEYEIVTENGTIYRKHGGTLSLE